MNIFFDIDDTIMSMNGSRRPLTVETFQRLREEGHILYIWSGVGVRNGDVKRLELDQLVSGVFLKPLSGFERSIRDLGIHVWPDFVVDDYSEIVSFFGGMIVRPYSWSDPEDREMERVYQAIRDFSLYGHSQDEAFRAGNGERPSESSHPANGS